MDSRQNEWDWTRRVPSWSFDWALAISFLALGLALLYLGPGPPSGRSRPVLVPAMVVTVVETIALAWRRAHPLAVLGLIAAAGLARPIFGIDSGPVGGLALLVATYSVGAYANGRWRFLAGPVAAVLIVAAAVAIIVGGNLGYLAPTGALAAVFSGAWLLGDYQRTRRTRLADLEAKANRLEKDRDTAATKARDQERARIARELHDVVAHDVTLMVVQAGAARTVQVARPEETAKALAQIEETGRRTLVELNHMLGVLRKSAGESLTRAPQPRIDDVATLANQLREAGIDVQLTVEGEPRSLPPALDLSAYRILQEATTNILKHARATRVQMLVRYLADGVELTVQDNGRGQLAGGDAKGPGHGLVGMRERAALFGAELTAGRAPQGGFNVSVRLPFEKA